MLRLSETHRFLQSSSFWEACSDWPAIRCVVIGRIPQAWVGNVTPLTVLWCVSRRDETKTIKPIINEAFVASSGDIITDYNDLYGLFKHYHVCICDRSNDKQQALLYTLKTHICIVSGKFFKYENILTGCESEASDCPCKVGIASLYRNSLCAQRPL